MNRIVVTCLLFGMLVGKSALAQSTESVISNTRNDLDSQEGPEEKPDGFTIYRDACRAIFKVASFGKALEALAAAEKYHEAPLQDPIWIATGNIEHANALGPKNPNRSTVRIKNCYVYTKSLRCGSWTLRLKSLTMQEAEAYATKMKERTPTAIIYELE